MKASWNNKRIKLLTAFFLLFFVFTVSKLVYLQVIKSYSLRTLAQRQRKKDVQLLAQRGTVYDRNGKELAISIKKQTVFATPYLIENKKETAKKLANILEKEHVDIYEKLMSSKGFVYIERKVDKKKADKIKKLDIEGISLCDEYKRFYPSGSIAFQLIGFVGTDNNGLAGIEKQYDKKLSGKLGRIIYEEDALGREIPGTTAVYREPIKGKDISLTIDTEIQFKAEAELKKAVKDWGAKAGCAIVMNPKNGEIYAIANVPDYELNKFKKATNQQKRNRAIVDVFEPGSTFKPFMAAAALNENIYQPDSMFSLPSSINVGGANIGEAHDRGTVNYSLSQIIIKSSNVGMSKIGMALKKGRIVKYAKRFGFDKKTGVDYPGETIGVIPGLDKFYGSTVATVCFGQGISTNALQLARGYSAFANEGYLVNQKLKLEANKDDEKQRGKRVIKKETAWEMTLMLENVVKEGTGKTAQVPGYLIAGKTGTAQKPEGGKYGNKYIGMFVGYAPAENAQVLVLVSLDEPSKAIYGGVVAAPAFSAIMEYSLNRLQINPQQAL